MGHMTSVHSGITIYLISQNDNVGQQLRHPFALTLLYRITGSHVNSFIHLYVPGISIFSINNPTIYSISLESQRSFVFVFFVCVTELVKNKSQTLTVPISLSCRWRVGVAQGGRTLVWLTGTQSSRSHVLAFKKKMDKKVDFTAIRGRRHPSFFKLGHRECVYSIFSLSKRIMPFFWAPPSYIYQSLLISISFLFFHVSVTHVVFLTLLKVAKDFGCHYGAKSWEPFNQNCFDWCFFPLFTGVCIILVERIVSALCFVGEYHMVLTPRI